MILIRDTMIVSLVSTVRDKNPSSTAVSAITNQNWRRCLTIIIVQRTQHIAPFITVVSILDAEFEEGAAQKLKHSLKRARAERKWQS